MAASDLASLAAVKAWAGVQNTASDALLAQLLTAASRFIYSSTGRGAILPATYTEYLDGKGYPQNRIFPTRYPVISVSSLTVFGTSIPAAGPSTPTSGQPSGYVLRPWDGLPPGQMQPVDVFGYCLGPGRQNIALTYMAGYQVSGEAATVPAGGSIETAQMFGPYASDAGVVYAATGVALTPTSSPPTVAGTYQIDQDTIGQYNFAAADIGATVLISYGFIPADLNQVCIEIVGERYNYRSRIGQVSKSLGGQETVTYSQKDLSAAQASMLQAFRRVTPAW
jgi:hypothetical protein